MTHFNVHVSATAAGRVPAAVAGGGTGLIRIPAVLLSVQMPLLESLYPSATPQPGSWRQSDHLD